MKALRYLLLLAVAAGLGAAELPDYYKKVSRLTWVVKDMDRAVQGWSKLGLTGVQEYGEVDFQGKYRGKETALRLRVATGFMGDIAVDMLQPTDAGDALSDFLEKHGEGICAIVHEVPSHEALQSEVERMKGLGVGVLQEMSVDAGGGLIEFVYFDTASQGKYTLALMYWPGGAASGYDKGKISQVAFVVKDAEAVSAYWKKLGFPAMTKTHSEPREIKYRGRTIKPALDLWWQRHTQVAYEWIVPPAGDSVYAEFLKKHGEGVQHLGIPVEDMDKGIAEYEKLGHVTAQAGGWGEEGKKGSGRFAYMDTEGIGGVIAELLWNFR